MCICLIYYGLGCDVDLPRSFVTLGGLSGLYKWKYARVNMLNGDSRTWSCINWVVLLQAMPSFLRWSESTITFDRTDHPESIPQSGRYPLMVDPIIDTKRLTKVLMDGRSGLNIMYAETLDAMGIDRAHIRSTRAPFPRHCAEKAGRATRADQSAYHLWGSDQL